MSEEEKKVIEEVKYFITDGIDEARPFPIDDWCQILLNLIENSVSKDKIRKEIDILEEIGEGSAAHFMRGLLEE